MMGTLEGERLVVIGDRTFKIEAIGHAFGFTGDVIELPGLIGYDGEWNSGGYYPTVAACLDETERLAREMFGVER